MVVLGAAASSAVMALPVWVPLITRPPAVRDFLLRLGGYSTREPELIPLLLCSLLIALSLLAGLRGWDHGWFWGVFWMACLIVLNQQVLTGIKLQAFHYLSYFIGPLAVLFLCDIGSRFFELERGRFGSGLALCAAILGFGQCVYRIYQPLRQERAFHTVDKPFQEMIDVMGKPSLRHHGFLTNDSILEDILPAYIPQKPLEPYFLDPLSTGEMKALRDAAAHVLGAFPRHGSAEAKTSAPAVGPSPRVALDRTGIVLVMNRHRAFPIHLSSCRALLINRDFVIARLADCAP
ncbi:MAG: hypothetical protein HY236_15610 [Acidobacteria bacterium]|nr:hypothetical protein [Acidobacteriota bacterium]